MENAVEALKMAFAVMMFILALTLSISSFSQARSTTSAIIEMRDRETEYTYVKPSESLSRTVGIETVVSSMYRSYEQNMEIYFKDSNGNNIPLFYETNIGKPGYLVKDSSGIYKEIYTIGNESVKNEKMHLDIILGGTKVIDEAVEKALSTETEMLKKQYKEMYTKKIQNHCQEGLYEKFKNKEFVELFGEYYQGEGANKIKKRVITYVLQD